MKFNKNLIIIIIIILIIILFNLYIFKRKPLIEGGGGGKPPAPPTQYKFKIKNITNITNNIKPDVKIFVDISVDQTIMLTNHVNGAVKKYEIINWDSKNNSKTIGNVFEIKDTNSANGSNLKYDNGNPRYDIWCIPRLIDDPIFDLNKEIKTITLLCCDSSGNMNRRDSEGQYPKLTPIRNLTVERIY